MKPRIFVSSTFYDLKYIREELSNFIKAHDFEPIMFEDGDIGYVTGKTLDDSCYESMKSADMVLLIIGGNYGSPATGETKDNFKEYMSVTRNEFKEAINSGIPLYAFVDNKVYAEYEVYEANYDKIEVSKEVINFRNTKDINVFRFIREIKSIGHISITDFEKVIQIKDFLSKQWSDMFKNYLKSLRTSRNSEQINDLLDNMKSLLEQMGIMVDGLGKRVIDNDEKITYKSIIEQQLEVKAKEIAKIICKYLYYEDIANNGRKNNVISVLKSVIKSLSIVREMSDVIDMNNNSDIINVIHDAIDLVEPDLVAIKVDLDLYRNSENLYELFKDEALERYLIDILMDDNYYYKLFKRVSNEKDNY